LERVGDACFALWNAARWEGDWVAREFELLRLAARAAQRPGQLLLIHSLERAFQGIQARVRPLLDAQAVSEWAYRAMQALAEAEPSALKRELLPLLRACDERVLERLAPVRQADDMPQASHGAAAELPWVETEPTREALSDAAVPNLSACRTGSCTVAPEEASPPEAVPTDSRPRPECGLLAGPAEERPETARLEGREGFARPPHPGREGTSPGVAMDLAWSEDGPG
jgi:hypothetical protein